MIIGLSRTIGPVRLDCVVRETHESMIEITSNPIETGAEVNDHAYIAPKKVTLEIGNKDAAGTYAALVRFQESRVPFTLVTGLTVYRNMLVKRFGAQRDADYARVLNGTVDCQEVIIVDTANAAPGDRAGQPGGTESTRSATPSKSRASDAVTADRASGTVTRGDNRITDAPTTGNSPAANTNRSILKEVFG